MTVVGAMRGWGKPIHVGQGSTSPGGSGAGVASISQKTGDSMSYLSKVVGYGASHAWAYNEASGDVLDLIGSMDLVVTPSGAGSGNPHREQTGPSPISGSKSYLFNRSDTDQRVDMLDPADGADMPSGNSSWSIVHWGSYDVTFLDAAFIMGWGNFQTVHYEIGGSPTSLNLITSGVAETLVFGSTDVSAFTDPGFHCFGFTYDGPTRTFLLYVDGALRYQSVGASDLALDPPSPPGLTSLFTFNALQTYHQSHEAVFPTALTRAQIANLALGDGSAQPGLTVLPLFFNNGSNGAGWLANNFAEGSISVTREGFFQITMNGTVKGTPGESFKADLRGAGLSVSGVIGSDGTAGFSGTTTATLPIGADIGPVDFHNNGTHTMQVTAVATVTLVGSLTDPGSGIGSGGPPVEPPATGSTAVVTPDMAISDFLGFVADTGVSLIEFATGSYAWRSVAVDVDRTSSFPLVIQPQAGATCTFTGASLPTVDDGVFIWGKTATASYITMQGFTFQNYLLWNAAIHGLRSTDHVSLLNMTFAGNTRDSSTPGSLSDKTLMALISMRGGTDANADLTIDNWDIKGAGRGITSGIAIDGSTVTETVIDLTNITIRDCDYAFYENVTTTGLTLDHWDVTNCGHAGASVAFHHATGTYQNMAFHSADPLVVDGSSMVDAGASTTTTPRASTFDVPAYIDATGATDVAVPLANWINSLPGDCTVRFNPSGVYKLLSALKLVHRSNMTFEGQNAQLKALGSGYNENYSIFYFQASSGGSTGIIIHNFRLIGNSPTPGTFISGQEGQHCVLVDGGSNFEIFGCTMTNTYGDGVEVNSGASHVRAHDNTFNNIGRNALSVIWGNHVEFDHNTVGHMGYMPFDVEPNTSSQPCSYISIHDNNTAYWFNAWFAVDGSGTGAAISDISVFNNVSTGKSLLTVVVGPGRKPRISITGNSSNVSAAGPIFQFTHVDGVTVQHNNQPLSSGALTSTSPDCTAVVVSPNP